VDRIAAQLKSAHSNAKLQNCSVIHDTYASYYELLSQFRDFHARFMASYQELEKAARAWEEWELDEYGATSGEYDGATEQACLAIYENTTPNINFYSYYGKLYNDLRKTYISE